MRKCVMRKCALVILLFLGAVPSAQAQLATRNLMGLGMPAELSKYVVTNYSIFGTVTAPTWSVASGNITQNATNGGNITMTKASTSLRQPAGTTISAAGTNQATCTALTKVYNNITTAGASTGVCLWGGIAGQQVVVRNAGANDLKVYPNSGTATINGGSAGAGVTIATSGAHIANCFCVATDTWFCSDAASAS